MATRIRSATIALAALAAGFAPAQAGVPSPGRVERVSVSTAGVGADHDAYAPRVSADGRFVAFESIAHNLVPHDGNETYDVFVRDRVARTTTRVSLGPAGEELARGSRYPAISAGGRFVAFAYSGTEYGQTQKCYDAQGKFTHWCFHVLVHDRATGDTTTAGPVMSGNDLGNEDSLLPAISDDGRAVVFESDATNLVAGDTNARRDIFLADPVTKTVTRLSKGSSGAANGASGMATITPDGRSVAFNSDASNLVAGDTNGVTDVFVLDRTTATIERVSVAAGGAEGDGESAGASITPDGRTVAFASAASNLTPGDTNGWIDVFVRDRTAGTTERASVGVTATQSNGDSYLPSISADGRIVAFVTTASNLLPEEVLGVTPIGRPGTFVRDRLGATTERLYATVGTESPVTARPFLTATGREVLFAAFDPSLVPGDTNGRNDVFAIDRGPVIGVGGRLMLDRDGDRLDVYGWARFGSTTIAAAADPSGDVSAEIAAAGGDLTAVSVTFRPERADLLVRFDLAAIPEARAGAGGARASAGAVPPVQYGLAFTAAGRPFELRVARAQATAQLWAPPTGTSFGLYRCESPFPHYRCAGPSDLEGSLATITGREISVAIPMSIFDAYGAPGEVALHDARAFTYLGDYRYDVRREELDSLTVGDGALPSPRRAVHVGIAPAGTPQDAVAFAVEADQLGMDFTADLNVAALGPGVYDVWARACTGERCDAIARRVALS